MIFEDYSPSDLQLPEVIDARSGRHWVYRHFDLDGALLYIGCTSDPLSRLKAHGCQSKWFSQIASVTMQAYPSRFDALAAEGDAIQTEAPRHNRSSGLICISKALAARIARVSPQEFARSFVRTGRVLCTKRTANDRPRVSLPSLEQALGRAISMSELGDIERKLEFGRARRAEYRRIVAEAAE